MRKKLTTFFLIISVLLWGTWFGGQLFNEAMVIPKWLAAPPESMKAYDALPTRGGFFFFMINPFFTLFALLATYTGWRDSIRSRKWLIASTVTGLFVSLVVIFYLAPLIHSTIQNATEGGISEQIVRDAEKWMLGNRIRLVIEFFGFLFSVIALRTWTRETSE